MILSQVGISVEIYILGGSECIVVVFSDPH